MTSSFSRIVIELRQDLYSDDRRIFATGHSPAGFNQELGCDWRVCAAVGRAPVPELESVQDLAS